MIVDVSNYRNCLSELQERDELWFSLQGERHLSRHFGTVELGPAGFFCNFSEVRNDVLAEELDLYFKTKGLYKYDLSFCHSWPYSPDIHTFRQHVKIMFDACALTFRGKSARNQFLIAVASCKAQLLDQKVEI
jgi:hypothetical protein